MLCTMYAMYNAKTLSDTEAEWKKKTLPMKKCVILYTTTRIDLTVFLWTFWHLETDRFCYKYERYLIINNLSVCNFKLFFLMLTSFTS